MTKLTKNILEIAAKVALDQAVAGTTIGLCKRWVNTPEGGCWWTDTTALHMALADEMTSIMGTEIKVLVVNEWRVAIFCGKMQVEIPNTRALRTLEDEVSKNIGEQKREKV